MRYPKFERETEDGEYEIVDRLEVVCDLDRHGSRFEAAVGGKPGLGNRILAGKTTTFGRLRKHMVRWISLETLLPPADWCLVFDVWCTAGGQDPGVPWYVDVL